jgi:hypothetical protein
MSRNIFTVTWHVCAAAALLGAAVLGCAFGQDKNGGTLALRSQPDALTLQAKAGQAAETVLNAPAGKWDLSSFDSVVITVRNTSKDQLTLRARVEDSAAKGLADNCRGVVTLLPGDKSELEVRLVRRPEDPGFKVFEPFMMYAKAVRVRDGTVDPKDIVRVVVTFDPAKTDASVEVTDVKAQDKGAQGPVPFFPFIDLFGQYIHSEWPGKIHTQADFAARVAEEKAERSHFPGPSDWDKFGGWAKGPTLKATGFFYVAKHEDKWWFVDPEGRLFWSYGPTGVGFGGDVSPVSERENWFRDLPARDDKEWGKYFHSGQGATYQFYKNKKWVGYDVGLANLVRKYGEDYEKIIPELSHERLRSWGFNTIGNWSDSRIYRLDRTPYTVAIQYECRKMYYRLPDIYSPDWEPAVRKRMEQEKGKSADDAWNLGYFVDNELWWGWRPRAACVAEEAFKNPADAPVKIKLVEMLQKKYAKIEALNTAWKSTYASWDAIAKQITTPDFENEAVLADAGDFGMMFAERYFSTVHEIVKKVAPNNLYLGSRFHGHVDPVVVALAAKYADVISYNIYDNPPSQRTHNYKALDVPILSSEWGVGSDVQQTPFRGDEKATPEPLARTGELVRYMEDAMVNPNLVGAHFFQFRDQPISGRPDGESVLRGFVNITDTPNFELIQANRRLASDLYKKRTSAK